MKRLTEVAFLFLLLCSWSGCSSCSGDDNETDGGTDLDASTDTDTDSDTDSDTDTDTDTDTDADTDTDTDTDSDTDADGGTTLPAYCDFLLPANANDLGWTGRRAMDNGYVVWRWIESDDTSILMKRNLETGEQTTILEGEYPNTINRPSISGENVFFDRITGGSEYDVFRVGIEDSTETQITNTSDFGEGETIAGDEGVVYRYMNTLSYPDDVEELHYYDLAASMEYVVYPDQLAGTIYQKAFGGTKWIVWTILSGLETTIYKYSILDHASGMQLVEEVATGGGEVNDDREEYVASVSLGTGTLRDLAVWDLNTNTRTMLVDDPWDQVLPDYSGNVVAYLDSQAGSVEASGGTGEIRVVDRDSGVKRVVLPFDTYYGVAIWGHFVGVNNFGMWGDSLIVCDLLEAGMMDADGHVCPESGCTSPDAGADGGN